MLHSIKYIYKTRTLTNISFFLKKIKINLENKYKIFKLVIRIIDYKSEKLDKIFLYVKSEQKVIQNKNTKININK